MQRIGRAVAVDATGNGRRLQVESLALLFADALLEPG